MSAMILLGLRLLMALSLYAFLGWALFSLWRDLKAQRDAIATRQVPGVGLSVQSDGEVVEERHYKGFEISIGRDPACDCPLNSETVSAQHARLSFHHNQWWLVDLGSTNGTFLNQEPVHTPTVVVENDQLRFGDVLLTIDLE